MKQFNLEEWLQDKSRKVVTRDGRPARIACTDSPILHHPIVGFVECDLFTWTDDGKVIYGGKCEDKNDLFFADEEDGLTEFEKAIRNILVRYISNIDDFPETIIREAKSLLDLARKELEANYYTKVLDDRMVFKSDLHDRDLQGAYEMGKQDALKDLPKWKKATEKKDLEKHIAILEDGKVLLSNYLEKGDYYIELNDLKSLPKEE